MCAATAGRTCLPAVQRAATPVHGGKTRGEDNSITILEFENGAAGLVEKAAGGCLHWKIPGVDSLLAPRMEILPVQMAALRLAEKRGIVPGTFRLASTVTLVEAGFAGNGR